MKTGIEIDVDELLLKVIYEKGGSRKDFESIVEVIEELAERKKLDVTGLLMVAVDCVSGNFSTKDAITQLKVNCGEFDK